MRSRTWMLVAVGLMAGPAFGQRVEWRAAADDSWCREDVGSWRRARFCEVREAVLPARGTVHVDARPNGGVRVSGWDRGEVRVRVKVVAAGDSDAEARAVAGQVRIETDGAIRVSGPKTQSRHPGWWVSFRLDVPRTAADLRLEADNGGVGIADLTGKAEFSTVNGGIHLERVGGHMRGETVNGGVHIELSGTEWEGEGLDVRTTNGGLHVAIPSDYNARIEMGTVNGGVHSDLPVTRSHRQGRRGGRIETDLGRGGRLIHAETTNGGVHLSQQ